MEKEFRGLGFRHMHVFNLVMLGKQGWRLMTNQDTTFSKVFKTKYFSSEKFLDVQLGQNSSFVWCNIHASQVVVRQNLRWRVRNGKSINV